ncbi:cytochrome P450 reductase 1 [Aureobasidium pullulans]|uniref:NADPH--cytochrome P450 reductase n=1 Tax=Aureobasidium pullulans TaxID=5580 RepID=A0A4S8XAS7_AURPU|nr:cytochrome P450 reductase 1 [Aureobasidium pullulans]
MANSTHLLDSQSSSFELGAERNMLLTLIGTVVLAAALGFRLTGKSCSTPLPSSKIGSTGPSDDNYDARNIRHYISSQGHDGILFYGSQTGTAEEFARRLGKAIRDSFDLSIGIADLEDYDMETLSALTTYRTKAAKSCFVGFVVATYGDGEPTDNAVAFNNLLTDDSMLFTGSDERSDQTLKGLHYLAFGLGNNTYEAYNYMVRHISSRLDSLGATRIGDAGEGDDGAGTMDEDFIRWKDSTLQTMAETLGFSKSEKEWKPSVIISVESGIDHMDSNVDLGNRSVLEHEEGKKSLILTEIVHAKQLYASTDQSRRECMHIEFDLPRTGLTYVTGDHVGIWPTNPEPEVDRLLRILALHERKDQVILTHSNDASAQKGSKNFTTHAAVLRHQMEICGVISRESLQILTQFTPTNESRDLLLSLSKDVAHFHSFVTSRCLNLAQLLEIASQGRPWNTLPFATLYDILPALRPRYYSISSSSTEYPNSIHITAAITRQVFDGGNHTFHGVTSNYLRALAQRTDPSSIDSPAHLSFALTDPRAQATLLPCAIFVRPSTFRLPPNSQTPIIMIGPGTGVAPFRAFVQERKRMARCGIEIGKSVLYFGCRRRSDDFLYADEWAVAASVLGDGFVLRTAFSRDGNEKIYVTHRLRQDAKDIFALLENQAAWIYICGDAKGMAKDVREVLVDVVVSEGKMSESAGKDYLHRLKSTGRFHLHTIFITALL